MQVQAVAGPALACRQVVGVQVENARTRAILARRHVGTGGLGSCTERFHRTDFKRGLGHQRKQLRYLLVDLGFQVTVVLEDRVFALEGELRVGAHVLEERLQVTFETHLRLQLLKLGAQARHFIQADLVDFRRRQAGRGGALGQVCVPLGAVGQCAKAMGLACNRDVLVGQVGAQPAEGRHQLLVDHRGVGFGQALLVGVGKVGRQVADRAPERRLLRIIGDHAVQLRQHFLHQQPGLHHAGLHAFAHVGDGLFEQGRHLASARQPVVVILHRLERLRTAARAQHHDVVGHAEELVDGLLPVREGFARDLLLQAFHQDFV